MGSNAKSWVYCLQANSRAIGAGGQWAGLVWVSCACGCWPGRAGLGKLVGQLGWTSGWLVPNGGKLSLALFHGLSYRVEGGVEQPGLASCL